MGAVVISGAAAGAISSGGSWQGALIGAVEAGAFYGVGSFTDAHFGDLNGTNSAGQTIAQWADKDPGEFAANIAGHGLVGGLANIVEGGSFQSGFLAAGFSDAAGPYIDVDNFYGDLAAQSATGGVGSVLGGGKFANGAETGAFGYLFNQCAAGCGRAFGLGGDPMGTAIAQYWDQQANYAEKLVDDTVSFFIGGSVNETLGYGGSVEGGVFYTPGTGEAGAFETTGSTMGESYSLFPSIVIGAQIGSFSGAGQSYEIDTPYGGASYSSGSSMGVTISSSSARIGITNATTQSCYISTAGHGC